MRRFRFTAAAIIAVLIVAGLVFWQPWKSRQQTVDFSNVRELLAASIKESGKITNYKYKTNITVGKDIKVSMTNRVVKQQEKRQMIDFSWTAPQMTGMASIYAQGDKIVLYNPLKDKWEFPSEEPSAKPLMDFFWKQVGLVDPVENLEKTDTNGKGITELKDTAEPIKDTVCVQVIPSEEAMSDISKSLPPQLVGAELTDIKQIFWISKKDLLPIKYEVRARVAFFGIKTMDFKTSSVPADYNKTEIKLPKRLEEKINKTP